MVTYPTLEQAKQALCSIKELIQEFNLTELHDQIIILPSNSLRLSEHTPTILNGLHF